MDPTEDLSARVLLRHILVTEPPRTPITRSSSRAQGSSPTRRSSRLSNKDAGAQTPQDILRRSLKHKMLESITRKSLPATKKRAASFVVRKTNTPATTQMLLDDGDTPRHILMNILRTEPARSPVLHKTAEAEEPQPSSASSGITSKRPSIELSGLDLPDVTIGNAASTAKVLSRKRPRRSLNVTAFEKRLKGGDDVERESEESIQEQSSLSLSSSTSLSLKTPFADVRTEKRGLQRRVAHRRKITEDEFGAAVNKRQLGGMSSSVAQGPSETAYSEGFTLGLSKLSEPDVTTDIVHCNTALYAQSDAMSSNFSIVATQDKPTVIASQLQRQMIEAEQEEAMEMEQGKLAEEGSVYLFPTEEEVVAEPQVDQCFSPSQSEDHGTADDSQKEERRKTTADGQSEDAAAILKSEEEEGTAERDVKEKSDEEENGVEAQREEVVADSQNEECDTISGPEEDATDRSQPEEEVVTPDSQTEEEEGGIAFQPGEKLVTPDSQTEEEEGGIAFQPEEELVSPDSQTEEEEEEGGIAFQPEEELVTPDSQTEEEEEGGIAFQPEEEVVTPDSQTEEEEDAVNSQAKELSAVDSQSEEENDAEYQSDQENPAEGGRSDSPAEDEKDEEEDGEQATEQLERNMEHISRRARSEVMPVIETGGDLTDTTETGWTDGKPRAHATFDVHSSLGVGGHESGQSHIGIPASAESSTRRQTDASLPATEANKEKSCRPSVGDSEHLSNDSPEEAVAPDPAEQEEEWEDEKDGEESEEVPSKTPAFVREKRVFSHLNPVASTSVLNVQASGTSENQPAPKTKQVRRRPRTAKREGGLPKTYLMNVFKHFAKTKVSADVYPVLKEIMDKFFERLAEDLETYAGHAKRKTIEVEDAELLLKRQGYVNDKVPVEVLIEKYLRMDQRKLLIPIATSGNVVIPKKR